MIVIEALPNNIAVWDSPNYLENTCRALPPTALDKHGKIVLQVGQRKETDAYVQSVIIRPIYDAAGNVDYDAGSAVEHPLPNPGYLGGHTDNHIVRQKDHTLLAMRACMYWPSIEDPKWWQDAPLKDYRGSDVPRVGGRGANVFWRGYHPSPKERPGKIDWVFEGAADPFTFNNGGADGYGGSDRPEVYACPFTGYIYLTANYKPSKDISGVGPNAFTGIVLLYSRNNGKDWDVIKNDFGDVGTPMVMTSTPNGRLFLYRWSNGIRLFASNLFNWGQGETPKVFPIAGKESIVEAPYQIQFDNGSFTYTELANGQILNNTNDLEVLGFKQMSHPSISRVSKDTSTSEVRVSYFLLNEWGRQTAVILNIGVADEGGQPVIAHLSRAARLEAQDGKTHSMVIGTFIDPDYISMPPGFASNISLFYWLEFPASSSKNTEVRARGCLFEDRSLRIEPFALSVNNGASRSWTTKDPGGDYMSGAFFYSDGLNYIPQWREPEGIRANIVTVRPSVQVRYVAVDPLAVALGSTSSLYVNIHAPDPGPIDLWTQRVREVVAAMTPEERKAALPRVRAFSAGLKILEEELNG